MPLRPQRTGKLNQEKIIMAEQIPGAEKKVVAGVLAILLGCLGIHKFYLGYKTAGIIMLCVSVLTCGFAAAIMSIIGIVEGILYLTKTDEEFVATYITNKKEWF
jgi:TM2 domain-containing membrane protein YozV